MTSRLRRLWLALVALALCLGLVACGGGGGGSTARAGANANGTRPAPPGGQAAGVSLQDQLVKVVNQVGPQVVQIQTTQGLGSGIVFDDKGDIVTNYHVVAGANAFRVTLSNGKRYPAKLVGTFQPDDLAVVRAQGANVKPATFADSSKLRVGDIVLAIGNPLGLRSSVTEGIVSALGRTVNEPSQGGGPGPVLPSVIQTSAPINPGNSGGALVDLAGHVVGIPTLAAVDPELGGSAAPGIGFAIPSNVVRNIASQIVDHGHVVNSHRAYLGVQVAIGAFGVNGAAVAGVTRGGPAAHAGIQPGDVIISVAGKRTPDSQALTTVLATLKPGQTVPVRYVSPDGSTHTAQVKLGELPATTG